MLGYALTAALKDAPQKDLRTLLRERVMQPIGVPAGEWSVGYNKTFTVAGLPLVAAWGGGGYAARAAARLGRLMLRQGNWEGQQLLSREAVRLVTSDAGTPGICGIGWWSNNEGDCASVPRRTTCCGSWRRPPNRAGRPQPESYFFPLRRANGRSNRVVPIRKADLQVVIRTVGRGDYGPVPSG